LNNRLKNGRKEEGKEIGKEERMDWSAKGGKGQLSMCIKLRQANAGEGCD